LVWDWLELAFLEKRVIQNKFKYFYPKKPR